MDKNEWYRVGEDIRDQVQRAVETSDFAGLGKTIGDTVNRAVGDVGQNLNRTVETVGDVVKSVKYRKPNIRPDTRLFERHPKGKLWELYVWQWATVPWEFLPWCWWAIC